jgi:hypothetical protein
VSRGMVLYVYEKSTKGDSVSAIAQLLTLDNIAIPRTGKNFPVAARCIDGEMPNYTYLIKMLEHWCWE